MFEQWPSAQKVAVIGAGTMGSGIAAHLANLGFEVTLFDLTAGSVNVAFDRAKSAKPPHFFVPETAGRIRLASIETDLALLRDMDWVCEAIIEKLDAKRELYAQIEPILRADAMITTNTSGLPLSLLAEGRSESFRRRFVGTHFFNPPRYLKLLELIPTQETDADAVKTIGRFLEDRVARRVVVAKDTPGFIANRYGMWAMYHAVHVAERLRLTVEQVDAITGPFLGRPRSGSFRLNDIVGLDVMQDIAANLRERCLHDPHIATFETPSSIALLAERGWIGDKAGQGYYRKEGKEFLSFDLQSGAYRDRQEPDLASLVQLEKLPLGERISAALQLRDEVGEFLRLYLVPSLQYAASLKEEISHNVRDFDRVMRWGFGWQMGPFEMLDAVDPSETKYYEGVNYRGFDNQWVIPEPEPAYDTLAAFAVTETHENFRVYDLGDGVSAIALTTKMGVITPALVRELNAYLEQNAGRRWVLTSEARSFSVGFDLRFFLEAIESERFEEIDAELHQLQSLGERLEESAIVAAPFGYCLGAGFELALSCPLIVAASDAQIGLPEAKVGLIPGGRGTTLMRLYNQASAKRLAEVALNMTEGVVSPNADQARGHGYLRPQDVTVYHPDRLLYEAKQAALRLDPQLPYRRPAWATVEGPLVGMIDRVQNEAKARGTLTDYDETVGDHLKAILAKAPDYGNALSRERTEFLELCRKALTLARVRHMVDTNKPLRN